MSDFTYRKFLDTELIRRQLRNSSYSLRAYARDLSLSVTHLSEILRGKGQLSLEKANLVSQKMKLSKEDREVFMDLVRMDLTENEADKEELKRRVGARLLPLKSLTTEEFSPVSAWYYMPLLELFSTNLNSYEPEYLAKRLGLPLSTLQDAIETLLKNGFLRQEGERLIACEHTTTSSPVPSPVIRRFHSQMLDQAKLAVAEQPIEQRHVSAMTISMSKNKVALAKERIQQFRRQLAMELTDGDEKDAVYTLSICLFENTKEIT